MSSEIDQDALMKIRSEDLRQDASNSDTHARTVILEVDLPGPTFVPSTRSSLTQGRTVMRAIAPNKEDSDARISATRQAIQRVLGRIPERYLPSAHAFVVDATGSEVRNLAKIPSIVAIWPNTTRYLEQ